MKLKINPEYLPRLRSLCNTFESLEDRFQNHSERLSALESDERTLQSELSRLLEEADYKNDKQVGRIVHLRVKLEILDRRLAAMRPDTSQAVDGIAKATSAYCVLMPEAVRPHYEWLESEILKELRAKNPQSGIVALQMAASNDARLAEFRDYYCRWLEPDTCHANTVADRCLQILRAILDGRNPLEESRETANKHPANSKTK